MHPDQSMCYTFSMDHATDLVLRNPDYLLTPQGPITGQDLWISRGAITAILPQGSPPPPGTPTPRSVDCRGKAAIPGFKNAHTHAAMTLLRGYGDDMPLQAWLQERIWPAEAHMTPEDIYWGTRLAALEMIKSGTTFANDMYFHPAQAAQAFTDAGIRAALGLALFDFDDPHRRAQVQDRLQDNLETIWPNRRKSPPEEPEQVFPVIAPHSIYTCSGELLQWCARQASENHLLYHIHMNETRREVDECLAARGVPPMEHLQNLGVLETMGDRVVAAHMVWLDPPELDIAARWGITAVHNPASNMKLASGCFPWQDYARRKAPLMLATDGTASNNNLDMFDEMKLAALLQKHHFQDSTRLPAEEILAIATGARSTVFEPWGVGGALTEGAPADIALIDLDHPQMVPVHNLQSNLVYSANGSVVDSVICNGRVLMENRQVPGEEEVLREARRCTRELVKRAAP
ncbi:amidohydrolase [Alkalispirochaeta americana]|nr:amidohydrolase [Alkalispirochaeta americana]